MKVILLAAGKGTRFLPLSEEVPKPLLPVAGAPVLRHILNSLEGVVYDELILITGHLSDQIERYAKEELEGVVHLVPQRALDGTGGAVNAARAHIDGPVLIIFGDTIFEADLSALNTPPAGNLIWTRWVADFQNFGIVQKTPSGTMARIVEKPQEDVGRQANIGLYYIEDHQALLAGLDHVMAAGTIGGEYFFTYALNHMVEAGYEIGVRDVQGWHDCGTLEALLATNAHLLTRPGARPAPAPGPGVQIIPPVYLHPTAEVTDATIGPNVSIGAGTTVRRSRISDAIIDGGCTLSNAKITHALVGKDQSLNDVTLEGSIVGHGSIRRLP